MKAQPPVNRPKTLSATKTTLSLLSTLVFFSPEVLSQSTRSVPLGPFDFQASVLLEYAEDDNLYQTGNDNERVDTSITTVLPSMELLFDNGVSGFSLGYSIEDVTLSDASDDDYTDQQVSLSMGTLLGDLHRVDFVGYLTESHDRQTVADSPTNSDDPDDTEDRRLDYFDDTDYQISYTLGTEESLLNLSLFAGEFEREYQDNREVTADFDREESRVGADLLWNVSTDLSVGLSYIDTEIEYVNPDPDRDGDEKVISLSLVWDIFDSLNADINIGQTDRETDAGTSNKSDYWDITLEWNMLSYSTLSFNTSSYVDETGTGDGSFTVRDSVGFSWAHEWTDRLQSDISYAEGTIEYSGSDREDDSEELEVRLNYQFRESLSVGLFLEDTTRSSNTTGEYGQEVYGISLFLQL